MVRAFAGRNGVASSVELRPREGESLAPRKPSPFRRGNPIWFLLLILLAPLGALAAEPPSSLPVWDFEQGIENAWGGLYNVYQREPSWARSYLDPGVSHASSGHSLRITAHRDAAGFCGLWMDLYPASASPRRYLDASAYRFLSFWIKGQRGGEDFQLQLADDASGPDGESGPKVPLGAYLERGVTTEWQQVVIPLADFHGLNRARLARLILNFLSPGDYRFFLDDIAFKAQADAETTPPQEAAVPKPTALPAALRRATWVWNSEALIDPQQREGQERFFAFCAAQGIQEVYLSLESDGQETDKVPRSNIRQAQRYRDFLERAHQKGLRIDALAGTPEWAVKQNHPAALAAVDAILAFNRAGPPAARFDGVHFDVEPYTLLGYIDPQYRPQVLQEFLELVAQCVARVKGEPNLRFSCDVPAWFYPAAGPERQEMTVKFRGTEKTVGEHLTDLLDSVTIMDYVNQADGAGGIIARGLPALQYAASQGKNIVVAVETFLEPDATVCFACGIPQEAFWKRLAESGLRDSVYYQGFRLTAFSDDINIHVGLTQPAELPPDKRAAFDAALVDLARRLGAASDPQRYPAEPILERVRAALIRDPEWREFEAIDIQDTEAPKAIQGFRAVRRMLPRITFHGLGRQVFEEETQSALEWLGRQPGFGGLAIHYYQSYRSLMEGQ